MIKVIVDNSYSTIQGLTAIQEKELKNLLSYEIGSQAAFFSGGHRPTKRSLLGRKGEFPSGLLARVYGYLVDKDIQFDINDLRRPPTNGFTWMPNLPGVIPYPAQLAAVEQAFTQERGIVSMPTGTGKSLVIALIAGGLQLKTLIVVPSLEIKSQLKQNLEDFNVNMSLVRIENIDSKALQTLTDFDCLIIDESHHVAAKTYQKLNKAAWKSIYHRFFVTATPFRNDTEETLLFESIAGQVIYDLSYKDAVEAGYIVPVEAAYLELPKIDNDYYTWAEVYSNLVVNNDYRNELIAYNLLKLNKAGVSTLCLVKEVAHGRILSDMTGLPFVNGADEESRIYISRFNNGDVKALIATTGIMGEGVDSKPCEYVIIAGLGKAKSAFMQQVGRAVRRYEGKESAKIILIKDKSHKFLVRHFNAQCLILKEEYGIKPIKIGD